MVTPNMINEWNLFVLQYQDRKNKVFDVGRVSGI